MKLKLNPEYARNHLFVVLLMAGLGCWFGYDGFVRYPSVSAHDLYVSIEKSEPAAECDLEAFKAQKIKTQYGFTFFAFLASAVVGLRLLKSRNFAFEFDDTGFTCGGIRASYADITSVDESQWDKKGILIIAVSGRKIALDAWHHVGVKDFYKKLKSPVDTDGKI